MTNSARATWHDSFRAGTDSSYSKSIRSVCVCLYVRAFVFLSVSNLDGLWALLFGQHRLRFTETGGQVVHTYCA